MRIIGVILIVTIFYIIQLGSNTCSAEIEYSGGAKFNYKLKGWYK